MPVAAPINSDFPNRHGIPLLLILITAGLAGNYFKFPIFFSIDFLFGSIFAMLALQFFGLRRSIPAAAIIAGYTWVLWNHPYAIIILTAEVLVVGWLMGRRRNIGMVLADALYWLIIGMPLVYFFYHVVMHVPFSNTNIIMIKQALNGIANALAARLIFTGYLLRSRSSLTSYSEIIYNLLAFFVLCPALIMLAVESRNDFKTIDLQIRSSLHRDSGRLTLRLNTWVLNRTHAITNLAEMAASRSPQQMQPYLEQAKKSDINFIRVLLINKEATSIAVFPPVDDLGQISIGKDYSDRLYLSALKKERKPMLSEIVLDKISPPRPIVMLLAPIVIRGEFEGYVSGILSLEQIKEHLDKSAAENALVYTLLDKNSHIIMTNRRDQTVMKPIIRGKGTYDRLDNGLSRWIPALPPNTPPTEKWKASIYVTEATIGNLAEWRLVLEQPIAPFQKILSDQYTSRLTLLFLIMLAAMALSEFISRKIVVTLKQLRTLTHELPLKLATKGKDIVWPESGVKEAHHLINNFREMAESLSEQFIETRQINESLEERVEERTAELHESKMLLERTFSSLNEAIFIVETSSRKILDCNKTCESMFKYSRAEMLGRSTAFLHISEEMSQQFGHEMQQAYAEKGFFETTFIMKRADGTFFDSEHSVTPIEDENGRVVRHVCVVRDISERKRSESALKKSEELYHSLVETSQDLIWQCDTEGRYTYLNLAWEQTFGYELDEMLGKKFIDFQTPEYAARDQLEFKRILEGNSVNGLETVHLGKAGNEIHLVFNALFTCDENGNIIGASGTAYDITQRKLMEESLRSAKTAAEEANTAKTQFLANMSHEIRTPMNGVIGLTDLLLSTDLTEEQRNYAELAKLSGKNLVQLISDILDLSKIETHKIELETSPFDLQTEINSTIKLLSLHAQTKALELTFLIDPDVPLQLRGDAGRLQQIINNLVGNAIKFTDEGTVSLLISKDAEDEQHVTLRFLVRDSGIGIASDKLETIFEPFTQADGSTTRRFGGTGLGLTISRQLAKLLGGTAGVESTEGEGSTFWFTVVLEKQVVGDLQPVVTPLLRGGVKDDMKTINQRHILITPPSIKGESIRLLLVEDDLTNQMVTWSILTKSGYQVEVANNGREALKLLENNDYALVLMDCMMPLMNGYDAIAVIRDQTSPVKNHAIPVIALTAKSMQEDREICLAAGMNDYLSKPLDISDLLQIIKKWTGEETGAKEKQVPIADGDPSSCGQTAAVFNMPEFVKRNMGDLELSCEVAALFVNSAPEYIQSIRNAIDTRDAETLRESAHKLKGAAANLSLPALSDTAHMIETDAGVADLEVAAGRLPLLEQRFEQAIEAIQKLLISTSNEEKQ